MSDSRPPVEDVEGVGALSEQRPDPLIGTTLADRFEILEPIARGGMGVVYRAKQQPLGRTCAVKTLRPNIDPELSRDFHRRFFLEASVAAKLKHPNTVTVYDYGNEGDLYFIAMEYIEGVTLKEVIERTGPLPPMRAIHIATEIARSVREAHELGVVHRDLKPANVKILDRKDDVDHIKVLDFGLVKSVQGTGADSLTTGGVCVGSPSYMAPEQVDGEDVSPATDIYSLGIVLYEMLCGRPPFIKASKYALVMAQLSEQPPALTDFISADKIPAGLAEVIDRCIQKRPADRYADMDELLEALKRVLRGRARRGIGRERSSSGALPATISATSTAGSVISTGPFEADPPRQHKTKVIFALAALAAIALGASAGLLGFRAMNPSAEPPTVASTAPANTAAPVRSTPVPAASAPSPEPASREVRVVTEPEGARVEQDGEGLCAQTPCTVALAADDQDAHEITLDLEGYHPTTVRVAPSEDMVKVVLRPIPQPRRSRDRRPPVMFRDDPY